MIRMELPRLAAFGGRPVDARGITAVVVRRLPPGSGSSAGRFEKNAITRHRENAARRHGCGNKTQSSQELFAANI
jgi:hypothetical protein